MLTLLVKVIKLFVSKWANKLECLSLGEKNTLAYFVVYLMAKKKVL
jgi:hypothetical protein